MSVKQINDVLRNPDRLSPVSMSLFFHSSIDGSEIGLDCEKDFAYFDRTFGIVAVTDSRDILGEGYKPVSDIEKRLNEMFPDGGVNDNDCVFTVEKDGFQTLVFEHAGQYQCSDWILETASGKLCNTKDVVTLGRLLVDEVTVGGDVLDRKLFYSLSKDMSFRELIILRESVKTHIRKTDRFIEGSLRTWFRPWTRLAGRIEFDIEEYARSGERILDEKSLSSILLSYLRFDEYKPYLDMEFKGYVSNKCLQYGFDYMKMAAVLRTPKLEEIWERDYPYLLDSKEWDLLLMAYNSGSPLHMTLKERPEFSNGFIGGETSWSRYLQVTLGPTLSQGRVTGIGQIDYKDCTKVFVILDNNTKALPFDALSRQQKHAVLERVFDMVKNSKKNQVPDKSTKHNLKI